MRRVQLEMVALLPADTGQIRPLKYSILHLSPVCALHSYVSVCLAFPSGLPQTATMSIQYR